MMKKLRGGEAVVLGVAMLILALGPVRAAGAEGAGSLNLTQALDLALKEHPSVKQARETAAATRDQIGISRAGYFPKVNFVGNYYYGNAFSSSGLGRVSGSPTPAGLSGTVSAPFEASYYFYQFQANQLLYDFGKTPGTVDQSRASFHQSEQDYFGTRQQVVLDARTAYFGYLAAQRAQKVQEETVRQNQDLLKQAQGFYQVGLKAKIDVTKAEANLYQAEANLIQAKNNVALAKVTLMNALGIKTWPYQQVEDVLEVTPQPRPLEELTATALQRRPELVKNRYQQDFNQAGIQVARAGYFPAFTSTAAYGWQSRRYPDCQHPQ